MHQHMKLWQLSDSLLNIFINVKAYLSGLPVY